MKTLECCTAISFKNILFLTDFTPASEAAFSYALALGKKYGARLYPAHVVVPFVPTESEAAMVPDMLNQAVELAQAQITDLFRGADANYERLVAQGSIDTTIPAWTTKHGIDLIVIGTHGRKGVDRFFLGSTAETVFRNATCPVLTVGPHVKPLPEAEINVTKILFATSLTKQSEPALDYALSFAQERNAELTVLHAVGYDLGVDLDPHVAAELAQKKMAELVPPDANLAHTPEFLVVEGDPAKEILECAKQKQVDLIVLGLSQIEMTSTHFRRGVAYKVISSAPCAVLTVR